MMWIELSKSVKGWKCCDMTSGTTPYGMVFRKTMNARIRSSIRTRVTNVAQVTSNALVLVHQYAGAN
ncbi:hypothetical protein Leryth_009839 [Lithospermum erythrorhizon]|nr:hypothetical protein Leryth_009839 [Lithospermum erythrorhizon]